MELPKLQQLAEAKEPKTTITSFLSSDDGAGYDITYIKKNYPDLYK